MQWRTLKQGMEIEDHGDMNLDFHRDLKRVRECAMQISRGRALQGEETASAKALREAHVWCVQGIPEKGQCAWNKGRQGTVSRKWGPRGSRSQIMWGLSGCAMSNSSSPPKKIMSTWNLWKLIIFGSRIFADTLKLKRYHTRLGRTLNPVHLVPW